METIYIHPHDAVKISMDGVSVHSWLSIKIDDKTIIIHLDKNQLIQFRQGVIEALDEWLNNEWVNKQLAAKLLLEDRF